MKKPLTDVTVSQLSLATAVRLLRTVAAVSGVRVTHELRSAVVDK
jgi:hypothetical protein